MITTQQCPCKVPDTFDEVLENAYYQRHSDQTTEKLC